MINAYVELFPGVKHSHEVTYKSACDLYKVCVEPDA